MHYMQMRPVVQHASWHELTVNHRLLRMTTAYNYTEANTSLS